MCDDGHSFVFRRGRRADHESMGGESMTRATDAANHRIHARASVCAPASWISAWIMLIWLARITSAA